MHPFVESLVGRIPGAMAAVLACGALFALLGLAAALAVLAACRRKSLFRREREWWTWLARLNYAYLPLLLLALGGSLGAVFGAHRAARGWIDESREPLAAYARGYLAELQSALNASAGMAEGSGTTVEALVARQMGADAVENRFARAALYRVNVAIVHYALDQVSVPARAEAPVQALRRLDLSDLSGGTAGVLRRAMLEAANSFFYGQYAAVLLFFAPLLLLPLAEYGAHAVYRRRTRRSASATAASPAAG